MVTTTRPNTWLPVMLGVAIIAGLLFAAGCSSPFRPPEAAVWLRFHNDPVADPAARDAERATMLAMIKSPFVAAMALRRPGIADLQTVREQKDPATWLSGSLEVIARSDSEAVQIRLRGQRSADLARIVNAVAESFLEDATQKCLQEHRAQVDALKAKLEENQAELRAQREKIDALARTVEGPDMIDARLLERDLDALHGELTEVRGMLRAVTADIEVAAIAGEPVDPKLEARKKVLGDQAAALVAEMDPIRAKILDLKQARDDLEARRTRAERTQRVTDQLVKMLEKAIGAVDSPPRVTVIERARVPAGVGR